MSLRLVGTIDDAGRNGNPPLPAGVTAVARIVLIELALDVPSKRKEARCSPSIEFLAERTRLSSSTVKRALRGLQGAGLVSTRKRRWDSSVFTLHLDSIQVRETPMENPYRSERPTDTGHSDPHIQVTLTPLYQGTRKAPGLKRAASRHASAHPGKCDQRTKSAKGKKSLKADQRFEPFWAAYAHKVGRAAALRAWHKALTAGADPDQLVAEAQFHAQHTDPAFRPHAATWLHNERWLDDHAPLLAKAARQGRRTADAPRPASVEETLNALNRIRA